MILSAIE